MGGVRGRSSKLQVFIFFPLDYVVLACDWLFIPRPHFKLLCTSNSHNNTLILGAGQPAALPTHHLARGEGSGGEQLHHHSGHRAHAAARGGLGQRTQARWEGAGGPKAGVGEQVSVPLI